MDSKIVVQRAKDAKPLAEQGAPEGNKNAERNKGNNVTFVSGEEDIRGNAASYLTARIARDRPDILQRMKQGDFKSVRQAALEVCG